MEERRYFPRVRGDLEWLFVIQINNGDKRIITETKDISQSGIRCKMDEYCEKASVVELIILLPLTEKGLIFEKVKCKGKTIRCELFIGKDNREVYDIAFEFVDLTDKNREKLSKYVSYVQKIA
ncbi:PilZ domain-containing protein [bacterium]|nr:PilZ domain-containing protein [bacterium]